jgi:hypothetical protein
LQNRGSKPAQLNPDQLISTRSAFCIECHCEFDITRGFRTATANNSQQKLWNE